MFKATKITNTENIGKSPAWLSKLAAKNIAHADETMIRVFFRLKNVFVTLVSQPMYTIVKNKNVNAKDNG